MADPQQGNWQRLADMQNHRSNFSLVVRGERLYAIGGDRDISVNMDTVEVYSPESDAWRFVCVCLCMCVVYGVCVWWVEVCEVGKCGVW